MLNFPFVGKKCIYTQNTTATDSNEILMCNAYLYKLDC